MLCTEFWRYTRTYREQPEVSYLNMSVVQLGDSGSTETRTWSSIPELNAILRPGEFVIPILMVRLGIQTAGAVSQPSCVTHSRACISPLRLVTVILIIVSDW